MLDDEDDEEFDGDPHVGCFSYPNCDLDPLGCSLRNGGFEVEEFGFRD